MKRKALGRGLGALIPEAPAAPAPRAGEQVLKVPVEEIIPNDFQPREQIDPASLEELTASIKENGIFQPVLLTREGEGYRLIAGERRWRAARAAGLTHVPAIVRKLTDVRRLEAALIENLQREDLSPLEIARGYRLLMDKFDLTQQQVAARMGKKRSTVANFLRLLSLPPEIQEALDQGTIEVGHAKVFSGVKPEAAQKALFRKALARRLTVRELEALSREESPSPTPKPAPRPDPNVAAAETALKRTLGTPVRIIRKGRGGHLRIFFNTRAELDRLYKQLTQE